MDQEDFESSFKFDRLSKNEKREIENDFKKENYKKIKYAVLVMIASQTFYILLDFKTGFFFKDRLNLLNLIAESVMVLCSCVFLGVRHFIVKKSKEGEFLGFIAFASYYFVVMMVFSMFLYSDMAVRSKMYGSYLSMLFLPFLVPFYQFWMMAVIYATPVLLGTVLNCFYPSSGFIPYLVQIAVMCVSSLIFRRYFMINMLYKKRAVQYARHLNHQANTDFLTGIANRQCLYNDFEKKVRQSSSVSMIMYDIDNFKMYNDTFSHISGDECLVRTTDAVNRFVKSRGGKMYRYGGEEFVMMFFNLQKNDFVNITREICPVVYDMKIKHAREAMHPFVSISAGAQFYKKQKIPLTQILSDCDKKLYEAKEKGKNCCVL